MRRSPPTAAPAAPRKPSSVPTVALLSVVTSIAATVAGPARALGTVTTYTGVVTSSYVSWSSDDSDYSGSVLDSLVGQTVTERFYTNDAYGVSAYHAPYDSYLHGTSNVPAVSSIVTVGGQQIDLLVVNTYDTDGTAYRSTLAGGGEGEVYDLSRGSSSLPDGSSYVYTYADVGSYVSPFSTDSDYHSSLSYTVQPGDLTQGSVEYDTSDTVTDSGAEETFDYSVTSVTVSSGRAAIATDPYYDAVPEPSAWATMLLGFGGIAAALRRRRVAA